MLACKTASKDKKMIKPQLLPFLNQKQGVFWILFLHWLSSGEHNPCKTAVPQKCGVRDWSRLLDCNIPCEEMLCSTHPIPCKVCIPASQWPPVTGMQCAPSWPWSPMPSSWVANWLEVPPGARGQESQRVLNHKTHT